MSHNDEHFQIIMKLNVICRDNTGAEKYYVSYSAL